MKPLKSSLLACGLWLWLGHAAHGQPEPLVKIMLTPPEARFSVRHGQGGALLGGPALDRQLPTDSVFTAVPVEGERSIIVTVHQPGYSDFERKYSLAPHKQYWVESLKGWEIPIELTPQGPFLQVAHELRFHPQIPVALAGVTILSVALLAWTTSRKNQRLRSRRVKSAMEAQLEEQEAVRLTRIQDADLQGKQIGEYTVVRKIGEGGFATVHLVEDNQGRQFALKILKRSRFNFTTVDRIERELEVGRSLAHPNLVSIVLVGGYQGAPYLIMDYVEGESLALAMRTRSLSLEAKLDIFRQICRGVAHAHAKNIMHRDLKPENIILTPQGVVKVLDFGMARPVIDSRKLTETGDIFGTPAYMAPEQLMGVADLRADIYSLGVILFELMAGELPFAGNNAADIMTAHMSEKFPTLAGRPNVPPPLVGLCEAMLHKDLSARIKDANLVLQKLDRAFPEAP